MKKAHIISGGTTTPICDFIDANFDLSKKTGGYVS